MAITTLYFSTASAGAGDGTSWANRAQLVSGSTWSTALTGFNFTTGSVKALIGPGTHSPTAALATASFANAPTIANPLIMVGCDSSGNQLSPPNPGWTSAQPDYDDSGFPVIATTTNVATINTANCQCSFIKFTASGLSSAAGMLVISSIDWCTLYYTGSGNTGIFGVNLAYVTNSIISMGCTAFAGGASINSNRVFHNVRLRGNGTANTGSGNRHGISQGGNLFGPITKSTVYAFDGIGYVYTGATAGVTMMAENCVFANNRSSNIQCNATASQTLWHQFRNCMITGAGTTSGSGYGIDGQTNAPVYISGCRLDRNASGNFTALGNYPTDIANYTTSDTDANEYVSAGTGSTADFRVKSLLLLGKGFGVADVPTMKTYAYVG